MTGPSPVPGPQSDRTAAFLCPDRPWSAAGPALRHGTTDHRRSRHVHRTTRAPTGEPRPRRAARQSQRPRTTASSSTALGRTFSRGPDPHVVLRDITLTVRPGEVVVILGASGCGKSTLLRIAGGLDRPTSGLVRIGGDPVTGIDPRCAVVFQEPRLLPWRTLAANVELGLPASSIEGLGPGRASRS